MAKRPKQNSPEAEQRKCATPNVGLSRQSPRAISRIFVRRRHPIASSPSPSPKKVLSKCSSDSISSDGESSSDDLLSSETNEAVYRRGFNSDYDDYRKYIADNGDENSSVGFKITDKPINVPLVQDKELILKLEQEVTSHLLQDKIKELREKYTSFRRVRGDGNCFLRAFKFAYLEHILLMNDTEEANRFLAKIAESKNRIFLDNMRPLETLMSDYDALCNIVTLVSGNRISHTVLLEWSNVEDGYSDPAIRFLRMVTSNEIRKRPNHFEESIQGLSCDISMTVQKFCEIEVEPMNKDVDNVQITAFVDALGVPIRIEYVHDSKHKLNHFDFGIEASPLEEPYITLLYRPGHYDILYTKDYHMLVPEPVEVVLKDSEIPEMEPKIIEKDPATSQMDPIEKDEDLHMPLLTYVRRKRKGSHFRHTFCGGYLTAEIFSNGTLKRSDTTLRFFSFQKYN